MVKDGGVKAALAALEGAPAGPKLPAGGLTTEYVQAVLEENQCLILAVVDSMRAGKMPDCAAFQKRLQANLIWLAGIADKQHRAAKAAQEATTAKSSNPRSAAAAAGAASAPKTSTPTTLSAKKPKAEVKYWTDAEHELFLEAWNKYGRNLPQIAEHVGTRTAQQVRSHMQKWLIREEKKRKREKEALEKGTADNAARGGEQKPQPQSQQQLAGAAALTAAPVIALVAEAGDTQAGGQLAAANPHAGAPDEEPTAPPEAGSAAAADEGAPTITVHSALLE